MPGDAYLDGERVTLRTVEPDDYGFVREQWNRPQVRRVTNRHAPVEEEWLADLVEGEGTVAFLPCVDEEPVGFVWLFDVDDVADRAEIGYWIAESVRGRGYATEAVRLLVEYAFVDRGLRKLVARVFEGNEDSERVLEKTGFQREGRLRDHYWSGGEYVDATLFGLFARARTNA